MRVKIALLAFVTLVCGTLYADPVVVSAVASSSWDQTIQINVPLRDTLVDFVMTGSTNGDGSAANPYQTYTSNISLSVTVAGAGTVIVTDEAGNIIYSFIKASSGTETLTFTTNLSDGVGLYKLTATFVDSSDPSNVYGSKSIFISYLATPVIPIIPTPTPSAPNTGVVYLGNQAFLVRDLVILTGLGATILATVIITARKKQEK